MGLESAPQGQVRVDPSMIVPRGDPSLNSPSATDAMISAFRNGQISAGEIADRALKHPAMVQALKTATDPELVKAKKDQEIAQASSMQSAAGSAALSLAEQQQLANIPQFIRGQYLELVKANMAPPVDARNWNDEATVKVAKAFGDLMDFHRENLTADTLEKGMEKGEVATADGTSMVTVSKATQAPVHPAAAQGIQDWKIKYPNPQAWISAGKPRVPIDLFSDPGTATTAPAPGTLPHDDPPAPPAIPANLADTLAAKPAASGRVIKLPEAKAKNEAQIRAVDFIARAHQTNASLAALKKENFDPTTFGKYVLNSASSVWGLGALEALKPDEMKAYNTAATTWTTGLLRVESGAAITEKEGAEAAKGFFPQVSDPPSVQQQKARLRATMEQAMTAIASGDPKAIQEVIDGKNQAKAFEDQHKQIAATPAPGGQRRTLNGRQGTLVQSPEGLRFVPDAPGSSDTPSYVSPESLRKSTKVEVRAK